VGVPQAKPPIRKVFARPAFALRATARSGAWLRMRLRTVAHAHVRKRERRFAPGRIRTCGLWLRRPTLYPAELRAHVTIRLTVAKLWCARRDLNPRPTGSKPGALSN
jgi:hypothetical protein